MRYPVAATHLARLIHMTGPASLARAAAEGRLELKNLGPDDENVMAALKARAQEEKLINDEARALADARKWPTTLAGGSYGWTRLQREQASEALPRLIRIYDREIFELEEFGRAASDDDEVRSLVLATVDGRRSIVGALTALSPKATLPGAK